MGKEEVGCLRDVRNKFVDTQGTQVVSLRTKSGGSQKQEGGEEGGK